ncbi:MAG: hypothetical protein HC883_01680 [Bdellovibrionaceae bacterium]|nr:hypothetical protein [Pseudobdellovibrionaceae bacterium]
MEHIERLTEEIRQIKIQYKAEVTGGRKQWPKAIKDRVLELRSLGLRLKDMSDRTGVSYHTIAQWTSEVGPRRKFRELAVVANDTRKPTERKIATVMVPRKEKSQPAVKITTVTVRTPDGFVIRVCSATEAASVIGLLRQGS